MGKYTTQELKNISFEAKERFSYVEDEDIMGYENIVKKVERVLTGKTKFCKFNIFEKDTISAMFTENDNVCIINETYDEYVNRYGEYADLIIKLYGVKVKSKVEEEPEATAETVESVEETTVSETETVEETAEQEETEVKTKMYWAAVRNKETNQLEVIKRDDYSSKKDFAHDLRANGYAVRFISIPDKFDEDCENYYWECEKRQNVRKCVSESKERMETAEQETELNAEVAEVEAEQTAEPETFSKSKSESESEPTDDSNTVETYQGNIKVMIVVDIANTFETITHTGYFDTS